MTRSRFRRYASLCKSHRIVEAWERFPDVSEIVQHLQREHWAMHAFGMNGIPLAVDIAESLAYDGTDGP